MKTSTFTQSIPDDLVKAVGAEAALLACRLSAFEDEKGAICVSFAYLADLWGLDKRTLIRAAEKLSALQIWRYTKRHGRGLVTEWKKGANFVSFIHSKKVQFLQKKGTKNVPNNKDNNYNNMRAGARESFNNKKNTPTAKEPRKGTRLTFNEYYEMFGETPRDPEGWKVYKPEGYSKLICEKL